MNAKHRKTLAAIMANPVPKALPFRDVESLLVALGCVVKEREGSRIGFVKPGVPVPLVLHRPHPGKTAQEYQLRHVRMFLKEIGVDS